MHGRLALLTLLAAVTLTTPASAQLRALAPAGDGPVLLDGRVVWSAGGHVVAAPAAGGAAVAFGEAPAGELAAGAGGVAVRTDDGRLFAAGPDGAFRQLSDRLGEGPLSPAIPTVQPTDVGVMTLERVPLLRDGAHPAQEVALPPGADPGLVAAAGGLGVAPTADGVLVVFDLRTDAELRQISLGRYDAATINGLAISPVGEFAATVPAGDGNDVLLWAPAGAEHVRVLRSGRRYSRVAIGGGRVAFVGGDGLREGVRAFAIDPATRRIVFRGPPASDLDTLAFDGRNIAFATPDCLIAGPAVSRLTLPPGACVRTDVSVAAVRGGVQIGCINAPARRCRVLVGGHAARVPRGSARVVKARGRVTVRVTDPDGRTRTVRNS